MNKVLARGIMTIAAVNDGKDGQTPHLHIAYANSPDGKVDFSTDDSKDRAYIGQYVSYTDEPDSTDAGMYTWSRIKGNDAVVYKLIMSGSQYNIKADGNFSPQCISIYAYRAKGDKFTQLPPSKDVSVRVTSGKSEMSIKGTLAPQSDKWNLWADQKDMADVFNVDLLINGKVVDKQKIHVVRDGQDGRDGHSLVAKVFMEGSYRNGFTKDVKSYVKVYYDGQEVTDFKVSYRYKGDWQKDWSEPLVTNSGVWGDAQRDGSTLFVEYTVEYKGLKALATGRLDNIQDGTDGKDTVTYKLIPIDEKVLAYITEDKKTKKKTNKVDVRLTYKIMKSAGEQVSFIYDLAAEGMTLTEDGGLGGFGSANGAYGLQRLDMEYKERPDDSYVVTLTKDGRIVDRRVLPITFKPKVVFDTDTEIGRINSEIGNVKGDVNRVERNLKQTKATVGNLQKDFTQIQMTSKEISLTVNNGTRPNLLWGSDLDLSEVQDVLKRAYELGELIKRKTAEKEEWKRSRDNASSDDDRMRYQEGMDACDREVAQAQVEVAKCREAIGKHLGVVISGDMEIGKKEMFQYLKGEGVGGSDAIHFKNVYKREGWAKWTNISWCDVPLKLNTTYTISVWVKFKSYGKKGRMYVDCNSDDGRYCFGGYRYKEHFYSRENIDEWKRVRYVFNSGASKKMSSLFFACIADEEEGAQCEIWLCHPKLEEGNTATPWCAYDGTVEALLAGGFDIKKRKFTATADNFVVQNNRGEKTFMVDENGRINNGLLNTLWFYRSFTEINDSNFREYMTYVNGVFRPEIRGSYAFYWVNVAKTGPSITFNITSKSRHDNTNFYPAPRIYLNYLSYMPKRNMVPGVLDNLLLLGSEMVIVNKGDIAVGVVGSLCFSGYGFPSLAYHGNGYDSDEKEERRHYYQPLMISIDKGEVAHLRCRLIGDRTNVKIGWEYAVGKVSRWNDAISYHPYYQPSNLTDMADGNYPVNGHGEEFTE